MKSPIACLSEAIGHAVHVALLPVEEKRRHWGRRPRISVEADEAYFRRPYEDEIGVVLFPQTWGSTALGFNGIGGAAMTDAYTVAIRGQSGEMAVYFGGRFAYLIKKPNERFHQDIAHHAMTDVRHAVSYYEVKE